MTSYYRSQPTRILYPTEIFRFQSTSLRNVSMNGDFRYTDANMSLPQYWENFQGLAPKISGLTTAPSRSITYTANASARRKVTAIDYGIAWDATQKFSLSDQVSFSNAQQPGTSTTSSLTVLSTAAAAGDPNDQLCGRADDNDSTGRYRFRHRPQQFHRRSESGLFRPALSHQRRDRHLERLVRRHRLPHVSAPQSPIAYGMPHDAAIGHGRNRRRYRHDQPGWRHPQRCRPAEQSVGYQRQR